MDLQTLLKIDQKFKDIKFFEENHTYYHISLDKILSSCTTEIGKYKKASDYNISGIASRHHVPVDYIQSSWNKEMKRGTTKGTNIHNYIEQAVQRTIINVQLPLRVMYQVHNFVKDYYYSGNYNLFRQELVIGNDILGGKPDNLSFDKFISSLHQFDYKTDKELKMTSKYKLTGALSHLEDCEFIKYSLQTSIYRVLFGKDAIKESSVVWFNENNDDYKVIKCLFLEKEAEMICNGNN